MKPEIFAMDAHSVRPGAEFERTCSNETVFIPDDPCARDETQC